MGHRDIQYVSGNVVYVSQVGKELQNDHDHMTDCLRRDHMKESHENITWSNHLEAVTLIRQRLQPDGSTQLNDSLHALHTQLDLGITSVGLLGSGEVAVVH